MPDLKISELPAATTPLAGTELGVLVQGGTTKKFDYAYVLGSENHIGNITTVATNYTLLPGDDTIVTNGTLTLQLPAGVEGKRYNIKNAGGGTVTVLPNGSETIDGHINLLMRYMNSSVTLSFNSTNWNIF